MTLLWDGDCQQGCLINPSPDIPLFFFFTQGGHCPPCGAGILENVLCVGGVTKPAVIFQEPSSPLLPGLLSHLRVKGDFVVTEHHEQESWKENHPCGGGVKCPSVFLGHAVLFWCCIHWGNILLAPWWHWSLSQSNRVSTLRLYKQLLIPGSGCLGEQLSDWVSACCLWTWSVGNMVTPRI